MRPERPTQLSRRPPLRSRAAPPGGFWPMLRPWPTPPEQSLARSWRTRAQAACGPPTPAPCAGTPVGPAAASC
eukprot:2332381-Alexandrium_andersonii.AAC.1